MRHDAPHPLSLGGLYHAPLLTEAMSPSPTEREREGPDPKGWEGEGSYAFPFTTFPMPIRSSTA